MQAACFAQDDLPTLLTSRCKAAPELESKKPRPVPAALLLPEEAEAAAAIEPKVLRVKNTFIDSAAPISPSLEAFYRERAVNTCPGQHVGLLSQFSRELAGGFGEVPLASPHNILTPCSLDSPGAAIAKAYSVPAGHKQDASCRTVPPVPAPVAPPYTAPGHDFLQQAVPLPPPGVPSLPPASVLSAAALYAPPQVSAWPMVLSLAEVLNPDVQGVPGPLADPMFASFTGLDLLSMPCTPPPPGLEHPSSVKGGLASSRTLCLDHLTQPLAQPMTITGIAAPGALRQSKPSTAATASGLDGLPSVGSAGHAIGKCKPCAFLHTKGCSNGPECPFCHLCESGEKKRRQRDKLEQRRAARQAKAKQLEPFDLAAFVVVQEPEVEGDEVYQVV